MLHKVISGGQDGVDVAALCAARAVGLETGGWMPRGWLTSSGPKPEYAQLGLVECDSDQYPVRTRLNVRDADATLYVFQRVNSPGMICTRRAASREGKPWIQAAWHPFSELWVESSISYNTHQIINACDVRILNVAGNRDINEDAAAKWFIDLFREILRLQREAGSR